MEQNYTINAGREQTTTLPANKTLTILFASISLSVAVYTAYLNKQAFVAKAIEVSLLISPQEAADHVNGALQSTYSTDSVATVVAKALYFRSLLTAAQISTLEKTYTTTLARKWSNLPCGSGCRNGIQFANLSTTQVGAALDLIKAAAGTATNQGFDQFSHIKLAEETLQATAGGTTYDSSIYFISFLNTPSAAGAWMLQYGGHHYAANIAYNGGKVVGTTPTFEGVEPKSFTVNSVTYTPMDLEHDAMANMLANLTTAQLTTAKLSGTFSDVTMAPGESNGNTNSFPATKQGLIASGLTSAQKAFILTAIQAWTQDVDDSSGNVLQNIYASEIDATYIGWTGSGTSGNASTFLNANTNYVRIDGPSVWIEFVCQSGVVYPAQIHYHSVYRDHYRDYGTDLSRTTLPLKLLSFNGSVQNNLRIVAWFISQAENLDYFEVEYSANPASGFTTIRKVQAANIMTTKDYTFTDTRVVAENVSYYRLKMVDLDGQFRYSNVASIKNNNSKKALSIYPNPASSFITLTPTESFNNATVKITNSVGSIVIKKINRTGSTIDIDISKLAAGMYFIQVENNGTISSSTFVKQSNK